MMFLKKCDLENMLLCAPVDCLSIIFEYQYVSPPLREIDWNNC